MKKKILVTGAAGFVGSFLCEHLVANGHMVLGIDNFFRGQFDNIKHLSPPLFIFEELDLSVDKNISTLHQLMIKHQIDTIFHLAAVNGTQYFYDEPYFVLNQNIKITQVLLNAIQDTKISNIIYTSSSEVYGDALTLPTDEETPILLHSDFDRDSYGASKAMGEFYIRLFCQTKHINCLILRVFNLYGERMINTRYGQVIPEFIERILNQGPFTMLGDGTQTRSFCYILDAIDMMNRLMEKEIHGVFNLGKNEEITILTLGQTLHTLMKKPFAPQFLPQRPHDHQQRVPNLEKLHDVIGPYPYTPLEQGLLKTIDFYEKKATID